MRVLITGITGFAGSHLAEYLLGRRGDVEVFGTHRWRSPMENIDHIRHAVRLVECDLRDPVAVRRMMAVASPDRVFHLAAQSYVPTSWIAPAETFMANVTGQLKTARELGLSARFQIAGSSEEYGLVKPDEVPIRETNPRGRCSRTRCRRSPRISWRTSTGGATASTRCERAGSTIPGHGEGRCS